MSRLGTYDEKNGFVPYDDLPLDESARLYSDSEAKHTFSPAKPVTNGDRVRAMTDEEIATLIILNCKGRDCLSYERKTDSEAEICWHCWLDWLRKEANENT